MPKEPTAAEDKAAKWAETQRNFSELMAELRAFAEHETIAQREARQKKYGELADLLEKVAALLKLHQPILSKDDEALLAEMEQRIKDAGATVLRNLKT